MFPDRIETDRLVLERLSHETMSVLDLYAICSDIENEAMDEVTRYMPWEPHRTPLVTKEFLDGVEERWEAGTVAAYAIRPRADAVDDPAEAGAFAGVGTLDIDWDRRTGGLGTWLRKRFWGRGYSGERAGALMDLAFSRLDLELVSVTHHAENENSRRAIERYIDAHGGRCEGLLRNWVPYGDEVADEYRYTVTREEFNEANGK